MEEAVLLSRPESETPSGGDHEQEPESPCAAVPLAVVASAWKAFDLEGRRAALDEAGLKIAEHQEAAMANRRQLADATREFKRSADTAGAAPPKVVGALLKRYQEEIDNLTRRAKHGEGAFLAVYQQLYEAPDPAPSLLSALEAASRASELEAQVAKLSVELGEYRAESKAIRNQDLTVRRLEEQVRELHSQLEAKDAEMGEVMRKAAAEADAAVIQQMQEREAELQHQLATASEGLATMKRLHQATQNQLFAVQTRSEEERAGVASELELASTELERLQERLVHLERERSRLAERKGEVAAAAAAAAAPLPADVEEALRQEAGAQREVATRLRGELAATRAALAESDAEWTAQLAGVRAQLAAVEAHARDLEQELAARPTPEQVSDLQQQVRILQAVGYGAVEVDSDSHPPAPHGSSSSGGGGAADTVGLVNGGGSGLSMEALLLRKSRHLEHQLTMTRLGVADARQQAEALQGQVAELQAQLASKEALVAELEEDLAGSRQLSGAGPTGRPPSAMKRSPSLVLGGGSAGGGLPHVGSASPTPTAHGGGGGGGGENVGGGYGVPDADDASVSMVRVLSGQRDRFRQRCQDLEEELARLKAELQQARTDLEAARADNVALVERLRFVHGYRQQQRLQAGRGADGGAGADLEAGADVEGKYAKLYEEKINPFTEFQGQQREQRRRQMGVADKAMYGVGQLVYQSPLARMVAFAYLVVLHVLVFSTLMHMSHHTSAHLADHHASLLDEHRHDLTSMMHHDGSSAG